MVETTEIGLRLKEQRELQGYTREQLAELVNITPRFCYDLEHGLKGMSLETLCKICETLNISSDYLLFGAPVNKMEENMVRMLSLFQSCPSEKQTYLTNIVTAFIKAVR